MKKILFFIGTVAIGIGIANAAVRDASSINRQSTTKSSPANATRNNINQRSATIQSRALTTRSTQNTTRNKKNTISPNITRNATTQKNTRSVSTTLNTPQRTSARATILASTSNTFGTGYNTCHDAYFSCMDQFCAKQNDTYRRCVCSSKLATIQSRERQLAQTSDQLQDFKNLNIEVIPKTGAEVKAMLNATAGEKTATSAKDKSDSAQKLAGISEVLSNTKSKALSTQGTLDIAGDINSIWATTDLASGAQISNLTGETLYNAVHSQCIDLISDKCSSAATLNMVVSAYGMYIENDCTALASALDKKYTAANATIRQTEAEMHTARLENYDAHNSTSINECIAQVRKDITADTACGKDYVHCLDVSGKYLNTDTGEPIYTADFYQLESAISLSGDILNNQSNRMLVNELNRKRIFAQRGLETCRDLSDEVWDEFMRQAITEIYQGQHERIRQVKNNCLNVVNQCYDAQSKSLKDFSNIKEQLLLGSRLELSEEMCREKLYACANLYGGGTKGMEELINAMNVITEQKIAEQCQTNLQEYLKEMCAVPSNDSLHSYPFGCRTYNPSNQYFAQQCHIPNKQKPLNSSGGCSEGYYKIDTNSIINHHMFRPQRPVPLPGNTITQVDTRSTLSESGISVQLGGISVLPSGNNQSTTTYVCSPCPIYCTCDGTDTMQCKSDEATECAEQYEGSLYEKLVHYAQQTCVRPSESSNPLPNNILQDINVVMDTIRINMAKELSKECERLGGTWVDGSWKNNSEFFQKFYSETNANSNWGYCKKQESTTTEQTSANLQKK